jgi:hypothetical protein
LTAPACGCRIRRWATPCGPFYERLLPAELGDGRPTPQASRYLRQHWKKACSAAWHHGLYGLALWAMTQAPLAVVAALRETSIFSARDRVYRC